MRQPATINAIWIKALALSRGLLPAALLLLSACADPPPTVYQRVYVRQEIPASLLTCTPWPAPDSLPQDVRGLVEWLARAKAAHLDCQWKLESVRGLVVGQAGIVSP